MTPINAKPSAPPWYKEPWPWILMAGPLIVAVAGFFTLWLAIRTDDGVVAEDYYQKGLAINRTLRSNELAATRHYRATIIIGNAHSSVRVFLSGDGPLPSSVRLRISHASQGGEEQVVVLRTISRGAYQGNLNATGAGRHLLVLEDQEATWRVTGWWDPSSHDDTVVATPE